MEQLETIAFYQLPTDYLQHVIDQLNSLSSDTLRKTALDFLGAHQYSWVIEQPSGY